MWKSKFYYTDSLSIVESNIFAVSRKGAKIAFPARILKKFSLLEIEKAKKQFFGAEKPLLFPNFASTLSFGD